MGEMAKLCQIVLVLAAVSLVCGAQLSYQKNPEDYQQQIGKYIQHSHRHHHVSDQSLKESVQQQQQQQQQIDSLDYVDGTLSDYEMDETERSMTSTDDDDMLPAPGSYIPSNCSSCIRREELRRRNLEVIKDQILSKLGMQRAPNMTGRLPPRIPPLDHLLDLYGMQGDAPLAANGFQTGPVYDEEEDDFHARTEKVIAFAQHLPDVKMALKRTESPATKGMESMYFKFSDKVTRSSKVDKAHLWVYIQNHPPQHGHTHHHHHHHGGSTGGAKSANYASSNATVWIHIYKVERAPEGESPVLSPVRKTRVALPPMDERNGKQSGGWVSIEVRKAVVDWFRWPEDNLGLIVHAVQGDSSSSSGGGGSNSASKSSGPYIVNDSIQADGSLVPFVEVVTTDSRKQRTKRTIGLNCDETSSETRCCRYPLTVDFVEFGWDWIIAPKKYEANYCSGECPYVFLQKYPHTHIVQQANPAGTAGPCCAPRKMSPISMLYFDNEFNIIHGNLPGMVVDRCGCS